MGFWGAVFGGFPGGSFGRFLGPRTERLPRGGTIISLLGVHPLDGTNEGGRTAPEWYKFAQVHQTGEWLRNRAFSRDGRITHENFLI